MRQLDGMEMICFCKSKHFELTYGGGGSYVDLKDEPVDDVMDMNCYICTASFYTREGDAIGYCPNCGHFDRKRFNGKEELVAAIRGNDLAWLKKTGNKAMLVQTWDGPWELKFSRDAVTLDQTGRYQKVVPY
ncbi:MAG: hypothetical protein ACI9MR_003478 [Myxococcota bacterium]|jgi:hypothetical protein